MSNWLVPTSQNGRTNTRERTKGRGLDWGDLRTWLIIGILFLSSLLVAAVAFAMPHGRIATQNAIHIY